MAILEVLIGLVLVYLTLSLVCSTIQESISSWTNARGEMLRDAIASLLHERPTTKAAAKSKTPPSTPETDKFYAHALIGALRQRDDRDPAYIPNDVFVDVLLERVAPTTGSSASERWVQLYRNVMSDATSESGSSSGSKSISPQLRENLKLLLTRAEARVRGDALDPVRARLDAFRQEASTWFENTMSRTSGWYKRKTQAWLFLIASIVVLFANADTLMVVDQLSRNPALREALVARAETVSKSNSAAMLDSKQLIADMQQTELRLGWTDADEYLIDGTGHSGGGMLMLWLRKLIGLAVTVAAVSLGAPFWFQVLDKLVRLRTSVRESGAEKKEEPKSDGSTPAGATEAPAVVALSTAATSAAAASEPLPPNYWSEAVTRWSRLAQWPADVTQRALFAAQLSSIAYRHKGSDEVILATMGLKLIGRLDHGTTQGFLATHEATKTLVIAFRGTETSELGDFVTDANAVLSKGPFRDDDRVHAGFAEAFASTFEAKRELIAGAFAGHERVLVTGHSLGAALATLCLCRVAEATKLPTELVTFGSPRVGNGAFRTRFEALLKERAIGALRFVNNRDLVTRVAPRTLSYCHVGEARWFDENGMLREGEEGWSRFLALVVDAVADFKRAAKTGIADHAIDRYIARLENWSSRNA